MTGKFGKRISDEGHRIPEELPSPGNYDDLDNAHLRSNPAPAPTVPPAPVHSPSIPVDSGLPLEGGDPEVPPQNTRRYLDQCREDMRVRLQGLLPNKETMHNLATVGLLILATGATIFSTLHATKLGKENEQLRSKIQAKDGAIRALKEKVDGAEVKLHAAEESARHNRMMHDFKQKSHDMEREIAESLKLDNQQLRNENDHLRATLEPLLQKQTDE